MIKSFPTPAAYAAAGAPVDESRVAQIQSTGEIRVDGVNVLMDKPADVCAVFYDPDGKDWYVRWDTIQANKIDPTWTHVGYSYGFDGKRTRVLDKNFPTGTLQWLACWQYAITAISASTIKFWLKMKGDYATFVGIEVTLSDDSDGYMNATTVSEINTALEAAGNTGNVGYENHGYWAFLDGDHITVQCDFNGGYQQYQCSDSSHALVGCTMALSVWGDMPASGAMFRKTGAFSTAIRNVEKAVAYYSTNGTTPSADLPVNTTTYVKRTDFYTSSYCAALRAFYGTYEAYMAANAIEPTQTRDAGFFSLPDGQEAARRWGNATFTKKDGVTVAYKFPVIHYGLTVGYGSGKFALGKWFTDDDAAFLEDSVLAKMQEAQRRMNTTVITNSVSRWLSRRYYVYYGWFFYGSYGTLSHSYVYHAYRVQAVALIDFD